METSTFNRSGQSLVAVLVSASLMAVVLFALLRMGAILNRQQQQTNLTFQAGLTARLFVSALQNPSAWSRTLNDPANARVFRCLRASGISCADQGGPFQVDDVSGNPLSGYRPMSLASGSFYGFMPSGVPCATFDPSAGTGRDECPFGLNVSWEPICPASGSCDGNTVQVRVRGRWVYNPRSPQRTLAFNSANYGFELFPGTSASNVCAPGEIAVGVNPSTGLPLCRKWVCRTSTFRDRGTSGVPGVRHPCASPTAQITSCTTLKSPTGNAVCHTEIHQPTPTQGAYCEAAFCNPSPPPDDWLTQMTCCGIE
jgi:hypothetical protein